MISEIRDKTKTFLSLNFGEFVASNLLTFINKPQKRKKKIFHFLLSSAVIINTHPIYYT